MNDYNNNYGMNFGYSPGTTNLADIAKQTNSGSYMQMQPTTGIDFSMSQPVTPTATDSQGNWFSNLFSHKDSMTGEMTPDYAGSALGLLKSGLGFYLGNKQLNQAEDSLSENKRQFNLNYDAQKATTNDALAWQYKARNDANADYDGKLTQIK